MTRKQYLEALDALLDALLDDAASGQVIGLDERHGQAITRLIRNRPSLEHGDPGRQVRALDAVRDLEVALARVRDRIRDLG